MVPSQSERWSFDASDVHDLFVSDDEVWLVGGTPPALTRMRFTDGALIAQPVIVSARVPNSRLIASPVSGIAVWHGDDLIEIDGRAGKARTAVVGREGLALPFQVGRHVAIDKRNIRLTSGSVTRWESRQVFDPDLTVIDGCAISGGKQVAIVFGRGAPRSMVVLDAFTGELRRRLGLRDVLDVRFAPRHHLAVLRAQSDRVLVLDLETTQIHTIYQGGEIADVAISANGKTVALLDVAGAGLRIHLGMPRKSTNWATIELADPATHVTPVAPEPAAAQAEPSVWGAWSDTVAEPPPPAPAPPAEVVPAAPEPASTADRAAPALHGLRPRGAAARAPARVARSLLELQLRAVASWCELAIAQTADADLAHVREEGVTYVRRLQGVIAGAAATGERTQVAQRHVRGSMLNLHRARKELGPGRIPIDELAHDFGLSPLAVDILLVVAAPVLWGELAEVYAMLSGERGRAVCHELLVCKVLGFPPGMRHEIATELDPRAPLVRYGLVHVSSDRPRPFATLAPEPLVIDRIRDLPIDRKPDDWARPYFTETALEDVIAPAEAIDRVLAAFGRPPDEQGARVVVRGRRGSGRRTLIAALAVRAGRIVGEIDAAVFAGTREHFADELAG
ncbi:MAG TPA: hypothetical protein VK932_03650, partial [Kofleriaceae bacterium]|nr:hypothetical protein [Kofleriaceae bacterium]